MPNTDRVTICHPLLPDVVRAVPRRSFPARAKRGWVEVTSESPAVAVDAPSPATGDPLDQEDES